MVTRKYNQTATWRHAGLAGATVVQLEAPKVFKDSGFTA